MSDDRIPTQTARDSRGDLRHEGWVIRSRGDEGAVSRFVMSWNAVPKFKRVQAHNSLDAEPIEDDDKLIWEAVKALDEVPESYKDASDDIGPNLVGKLVDELNKKELSPERERLYELRNDLFEKVTEVFEAHDVPLAKLSANVVKSADKGL